MVARSIRSGIFGLPQSRPLANHGVALPPVHDAATSPANSNRTAPRMGGYATSTRVMLEDWLAARSF
jgi:hypothetical protein